ncbi:lipopolysaccharide assembly protein LapB [Avibacterium paragallinarum]|uniref:lipopolysaccharide assembly protein LapB n=1 Tax=Avibacterium paragallinarum TaxID=728 RepID=UPI00061503BA|nr:lipopolysaccharide assembly protein LapB [Avibacterium paragallinarum]KAA6209127.1 lipopolysaccharide assembly protein LapB [Avibacterium paragallinarum]KKB00742.1 hypothetical protein Z012_10365 [Avibacterium paragallinarum]RZN73720.1 lipopolysaccharide assembly protein LapB [Avibacterium paragallinarum]
MLELLFLLLPVAAAYGWYMGYRSAKKEQEDISNRLSRDYVTSVNLLLSNQQDKAVDLFLDILQKQEQENEIEKGSQFEAELTLGNLFRSRGEVDRALKIHQALERSPNYSFEQKLLARQQLAKDFMMVGFFDRAESLYITLVDEPEFAENALNQLMLIYQTMKDWLKAINVAEKLAKISDVHNSIVLAHYYCEYAENVANNNIDVLPFLQQALKANPKSIRASLLLAEYHMLHLDYQSAVENLEKILDQNADYIGEALPILKYCYQELRQPDDYELFLIKASRICKNSAVDLALSDFIAEKEGSFVAQTKLYQYLTQNPTTIMFHRFIQYQIDIAENGKAKDSLILLHKIVGERIKQGFDYRCTNCGYQTHKLIWCCPSCRQWESIKPTKDIEYR